MTFLRETKTIDRKLSRLERLKRRVIILVITSLLFQSCNVMAYVDLLNISNNTIDRSLKIPQPARQSLAIMEKEKSKHAKLNRQQELEVPHAARELNHSLRETKKIAKKIQRRLSKGKKVGALVKQLRGKLVSLRDLDSVVKRNLRLAMNKAKTQSNETRKRQKQRRQHYNSQITPILSQLENMLNRHSNVNGGNRKVKLRTAFSGALDDFIALCEDRIKDKGADDKYPTEPTFRKAKFKRKDPKVNGTVQPAYIAQHKAKKNKKQTNEAVFMFGDVASKSAATADSSSLPTVGMSAAALKMVSPPTATDLAATVEVEFTADILALAAELNNSPARIFQWVQNNIRVEFYHGSMKGSRGTLLELAGNDVDTSSLLLALLRAAGAPSRYVEGTVDLPIEKARNLTGITDNSSLGSLFASAGIPTVLISDETGVVTVRIEHTWVEAYVDYDPLGGAKAGPGDLWVPLSAWYKPQVNDEGLDIVSDSGFNSDTFLNDFIKTVRSDSVVDGFKLFLDDYLKGTTPGISWQDSLKTQEIENELFRTLPNTLNFEVVSINAEYAELPDSLRHKITISLPGLGLSHGINLSEVVGRRVTLSYPPADEASRILIDSSGGIENVDPLSVNLLPSLKIEGETVSTGTIVRAGYTQTLRTVFQMPGAGSDTVDYSIISGAYYAVGLDPQLVSTAYLSERIAEHISTVGNVSESTDNMDDITGEILYLAVMRYFNDVNAGDKTIAQALKSVFLKQTSGAITGKTLSVSYLFGTPADLGPGGYFVDAKRNIYTPISSTGDNDDELDFMLVGGYNSSFYEHELFESFFNLNAISTLKLLALASEADMPIYDIDSSNVGSILPLLTLNSSVKSAIQSAVFNGHKVKVHRDELTVQNWQGAGYIDLDPTTNAAGYIISGGWAGGATVDEVADYLGDLWGDATNWFWGGDPVNIANGNLLQTDDDLTVATSGLPVSIKRHYNSFSDYNGPFGYGWSHTYDEEVTENLDESLTYKAGDGGKYTYTKNGDDSYKRPLGIYSDLIKSASGYTLTEKDGTQHVFNTQGRLTSMVDRNANTLTFTYSGNEMIEITDPAGRSFVFAYNSHDKIETITAPGVENVWTYTYDDDDLISIVNNAGQEISYSYYADHKMASRTNEEGATVTHDYYSNGKTHMNLMPNGGTYLFSYNGALSVTTITDPEGNSTSHYFNKHGAITGILDPLGFEELYEYDDNLNRVKVTGKNGGITRYTYDANGNILTETNPLNHVTTYTYESTYNQVLTITDPEGYTITNSFDGNGNVLVSTDAENVVTEFEYFPNGLTQLVKKGGVVKSESSYFPEGTQEWSRDAYGHTTNMTYDELGRLTSQTDPSSHSTQYEVDAAGNVLKTTDPENIETEFTYSNLNLRASMTDGKGNLTVYAYNNWGKLIKVTDPMGLEKTYTYNLNYDLSTKTDKNGNVTGYEYDPLKRLSKKSYADGTEELFSYDSMGNKTRVVDRNGTTLYEYDFLNRLIKTTDTFNQVVQYTYSTNDTKATMVDPLGGTTSYEYYNDRQLKTVVDPNSNTTNYFYENGLLSRMVFPNGNETSTDYFLDNTISQIVNTKSNGVVISSFAYLYDAAGNRTQMTDNEGVHSYQYDDTNQLTRVDYPDGSFNEYTYDNTNNRRTLTTPNGETVYSYDDNSRLITAGAKTYTFDNNGNQLSEVEGGLVTQFQYDMKNQLSRIDYPSNSINQFTYNYSGQRIAKKDNSLTKTYLYDGSSSLMETDGKGVVTSRYVNGGLGQGALYAMSDTNQYTYFMKDALGSIAQLTNTIGDMVESYSYDVYGALKAKTTIDDRGIRLSFSGKTLDKESNLTYFGARYYNAETGRFINADSYTHGPDDERVFTNNFDYARMISAVVVANPVISNVFAYVINSPTNHVDLDGHIFMILLFYSFVFGVLATAVDGLMGDVTSPVDALGHMVVNMMLASLFAFSLVLTIGNAPLALQVTWGMLAFLGGTALGSALSDLRNLDGKA